MLEPLVGVSEARTIILAAIKPLGVETARLASAAKRILAENVTAKIAIPPFDNAAMDGFAVRISDLSAACVKNPVRLKIIEEVQAGAVPMKAVKRGETVSIMTGAPMPKGADMVIPIEDVKRESEEIIVSQKPRQRHLRKAGEVAVAGSIVLETGVLLGPAEIGFLAAVGVDKVCVSRRPKVAIISTGDELVEPGRSLPPGMIYASNAAALVELVRAYGGAPINMGIARDNEAAIERKVRAGLSRADAVITSGGVSAGEYDYVKAAMARLDAGPRFWRVRMRPGQPLAFAVAEGKPIFGLPGNPVAVMVSFFEFARCALLKMQSARNPDIPTVQAVLDEAIKARPNYTSFIRAKLTYRGGEFHATTTGLQGSALIGSLAAADALLVIGEKKTNLPAGAKVDAQILDFIPPRWRGK